MTSGQFYGHFCGRYAGYVGTSLIPSSSMGGFLAGGIPSGGILVSLGGIRITPYWREDCDGRARGGAVRHGRAARGHRATVAGDRDGGHGAPWRAVDGR